MNYTVPINGEWQRFTDTKLQELAKDGKDDIVQFLLRRLDSYHKNPLSYFLPHGVPYHKKELEYAGGRIILPPSHYPKKWKNDGVAFMNDWERDYLMLKAPRKTGKSIHGAAKIGMFMLKCDPNWECFQKHGLVCREWQGPQTVVVASFGTGNLKELWKVYQEVWPREELGQWASDWGKYEGETSRPKFMSFGDGRPKSFYPQKSGGEVLFMHYGQMQHFWENFKASALHADEQIPVEKLNAYEDGTRVCGDYTPVFFTFSGFRLPNRPDTGAAGPLKPIWDGRTTRGNKVVAHLSMDIASTPEVFITPQKKKDLYDQYENPDIDRDRTTERRGMGTYYPGWEPGGGLAFGPDVWQPEIHVIEPLWPDDQVPDNWTKWRVIDYADRETTVCGWFAVGPKFAVLYRLLYEKNLLVAQTVRKIIEMSHNKRQFLESIEQEETENIVKVYEEIQSGEEYYRDIMDSRAGSWRQQGEKVIDLFRRGGMEHIDQTSGGKNVDQIPVLKNLLAIDWDKPHPFLKDKKGEPVMGCPSLFIFSTCSVPVIDEFASIALDEKPGSVSIIDKKIPHDFMDVAKYFATDNPQCMGDFSFSDEVDQPEDDCEWY